MYAVRHCNRSKALASILISFAQQLHLSGCCRKSLRRMRLQLLLRADALCQQWEDSVVKSSEDQKTNSIDLHWHLADT